MRRLLTLLLILLPVLAFGANNDDGQGYLTQLLEKNLSGAGRQVHITGFEGALSSKASLKTLTIADGQGVWLTLKGVTLDWSRAALLTGKVQVDQLTADEIDLPRLPASQPAPAAVPSAEAAGFSLPTLPVSVNIGKIEAKKVVLGAPVLGQPATVKVSGSAQLSGGDGSAKIDLQRIDGQRGQILLDASYANDSRQLDLNLKVDEAAGGIVTTAIGLPNAPALKLSVAGKGPTDDFTADINLATDNQPRLSGQVVLKGETGADGKVTNRFTADIGGDIAPLFAPDYRDFFGRDIKLQVAGARLPSGQVQLSQLNLKARQIALQGQVDIGTDGMPSRIDLTGRVASNDGTPVLLPLPGKRTTLNHADLQLTYNAAKGDGWQGTAQVVGFKRPDLTLADATLTGKGRIAKLSSGDKERGVEGTLTLKGTGIAPADPALARALGSAAGLTTQFSYRPGGPLDLPGFTLSGADYTLKGKGSLSGLSAAGLMKGEATLTAQDLSRFSGLAGRDLGGSVKASVSGQGAVLAGSFDIQGAVEGKGLKTGYAQADEMLKGDSRITLSVQRDKDGTEIRHLALDARSLSLNATGSLHTGAADIRADLSFDDLSQLGKGYGGKLSARASLTQQGDRIDVGLRGTGQDLRLGQDMADRLLRGKTSFDVAAHRKGNAMGIDKLEVQNPQLSASAAPAGKDTKVMAVKARLANLALVASGFSGPVTADGTIKDTGQGYGLDLSMQGPGGIDAKVAGNVAGDFATADVSAKGRARIELINPLIAPRSVSGPLNFDLSLKGPLKLASVSGRIGLSGGRVAAPILGLSATGTTLDASFAGGQAQVKGQMDVGGGTITMSGPVSLLPPYDSNLQIGLNRVGLKDPELYTTTASGSLTVKGPMAGGANIAGRIGLGTTEIRVPSTGIGGTTSIPEGLVQKGASAPVRATLTRAGQGVTPKKRDAAPPARPFNLNVTVSAPSQVFVRGRGLDAELGGQIAITGTSANIIPIGGFDLRRGRLEILGKRLDLTEGSLRLQGRFVPWVHLVASSSNDGVTAMVNVDGDATDPQITFSSSPALPQEEVLSQLLFGRGLSKISPFQAAQLASAVATLAGKGGEGIVSKLRKGFGLDDLDIQTDAQGQTSVKVGKYISKRIYTDVTVGQDGTSQIDLNLDVTKSVTLKGKASSDGNTGIGIYYERDY